MKMRTTSIPLAALFFLISSLCGTSAQAQEPPEIYTATVIASEGLVGSSGRINIRIESYSTNDERAKLRDAFKKSTDDGLALLRTMSKGFVNIEGKDGRKIQAAFSRDTSEGYEIIVICEHLASRLEQWNGVKAEDHPVAVIHLKFARTGAPVGGEVFPAVKVSLTPDGYVDVKTDSSNKISMINLARK